MDPSGQPLRRLAVIGGGAAGVATAWLCDPDWTIDLFESRSVIGGHAATVVVQDDGEDVAVDIGAESFNPGTHPLYWALLQEIDAIESTRWGPDPLVEMPATLSIYDAATKRPLFVSTHALYTLKNSVNFFGFSRAGLGYLASEPSADLTAGEWLDGLWLDRAFKQEVLTPWLASLTCCDIEQFRGQSILAFLLQFVRTFPENIFRTPKSWVSDIGLAGFLRMLLARCERVTAHTDAEVTKVGQVEGAWFVEAAGERRGPYEKVVVNAPPHASRRFLAGAPRELLDVLDRHEYYSSRLVVHTDPQYMPERKYWCSHNGAVDGDRCEATVWLGSSRRNRRTGEPLQLFKSWASRRREEPRGVVAERTFLHPAITPATMRATRDLAAWQGWRGLHFAGHFTTLTDLQETAVYSSLQAARALCPDSERLRSLELRIERAGKSHVCYDVGSFRQ